MSTSEHRSVAAPRAERSPLTLLLVEDSPDDAQLVLHELRRDGIELTFEQVASGASMEEALRRRRWDVIFSDFHMPAFDAFAALAIRQRLAPDTPFIVVSGTIGEAAAVSLLKSGADDYVSKETLGRLVPAVRRELREAEQRRARREAEAERERLLEELARALEVRSDFLSIASHELRTPLTALRFNLHSIERAAVDGDRARIQQKVADGSRQIQRLDELISDLMSITDVRPSDVPLVFEETRLGSLVKDVVEEFAARSGGQITVAPFSDDIIGRWDPRRVREVLRRLLSNAAKFGAGKPIEVTLSKDTDAALVSVRDHGIGVSAEDQERIFDRFGRAVPVKNFGGFGLGLWIARNIVEAHGGTLTVTSQPDQGATFTMRLPLLPPELPAHV